MPIAAADLPLGDTPEKSNLVAMIWSRPPKWPQSPVIRRDVRGRVERLYGRCHAYLTIDQGCFCFGLEREGRQLPIVTCPPCIEASLRDVGEDARELLLLTRFIWAWQGQVRLSRAVADSQKLGADDRLIMHGGMLHGPHLRHR